MIYLRAAGGPHHYKNCPSNFKNGQVSPATDCMYQGNKQRQPLSDFTGFDRCCTEFSNGSTKTMLLYRNKWSPNLFLPDNIVFYKWGMEMLGKSKVIGFIIGAI